ncbi:MAG: hypothetical protein FWD58_03045 [Firmicutes bacterium]|nr:hypothetical protein [Bacillota bacterium]
MPADNEIQDVFGNAERIWAEEEGGTEDRVIFRRKFSFKEKESPPRVADLFVACEGSYNLYVNGKLIVLDGSVTSARGTLYYDEIDVGPFLQKGDNALVFMCRFSGDDPELPPMLIFACSQLEIYSNPETQVFRSRAYKNELNAAGGRRITYDASLEGQIVDNVHTVSFESNVFSQSVSAGRLDGELRLLARPIPLYRFSKLQSAKLRYRESEGGGEVYEADLDGAGFYAVRLEVERAGGTEQISIRTDRYFCRKDPESGGHVENTAFTYICKNGRQAYDIPVIFSGTKLSVKAPKSIKIGGVYYYKSEYDFKYAGDFECGDKRIDRLLTKAEATIEACMRDTLYASPDRAPGFSPAVASLVFGGAAYVFDGAAMRLVQKCVSDYLSDLEEAHEKFGAFDNLLALSARGFIASYANAGGDLAPVKRRLPAIARYLSRFNLDGEALILPAELTEWELDYYRNVDMPVLMNAVFVSAVEFFLKISDKIGVTTEESEVIAMRARTIKRSFGCKFKRAHGYASGDFYDERANAWVVIAGLAEVEMYPALERTLLSCQNCSPQFETYVLEALFRVGAAQNALTRLKNRFRAEAENDEPTLCEGFYGDGAPCFSASAGFLHLFYRYIAGVEYSLDDKLTIYPCLTAFDEVRFSVAACGDTLRGVYRADKKEIFLDVPAACVDAEAVLDPKWIDASAPRVVKLTKGKNKFNV